MKVVIPNMPNALAMFVVDGKKDEDVGVIMTYISWDILFPTSGSDNPREVWKKLKSLFEKVDES